MVAAPAGLGKQALRAVAAMAAAALIVSLMHVCIRIAGAQLSPFVVTFFRALFTLAVMAPLVLQHPERRTWRTARPGLQLLRGGVSVLSVFCWYFALATIPLANAIALNFTSSIFITMGAALVLKEPVGPRRWSAVLVGLIGALIVVRPGAEVSWGAIAALVASLLWAVSFLMMKRLSAVDSNRTIVFYSAVLIVPLSAPAALATWQMPSLDLLGLLAFAGLCGAVSHLLMAEALRSADAVVTVPVDFTRLIWGALFGYLLFAELPDRWTLLGAGLIIGANLYSAWREYRRSRGRDPSLPGPHR